MKYILLFVVLLLYGCKSSQVAEVKVNEITLDSIVFEQETKDWVFIGFSHDSTSSVTIDSAGNITAIGVNKVVAKKQSNTTVQEIKQSATTVEEKKVQTQSKTREQSIKWYDKFFMKVGFLCCIALLIYAVFLYIKRRNSYMKKS